MNAASTPSAERAPPRGAAPAWLSALGKLRSEKLRSPRVLLASASPRRRELLDRLGVSFLCVPPDLDDAELTHRAPPLPWAVAMSWFKAARVAWMLAPQRRRERQSAAHASQTGVPQDSQAIILAADTVCDLDGHIIGKPRDRAECAKMLRAFAGRAHRVHTGFCLLDPQGPDRRPCRWIGSDSAIVQLGSLTEAEIRVYANSDAWIGKAGGYNFEERIRAGWPLRCDGDPTTVMGLPLRVLEPTLLAIAGGAPPVVRSAPAGERSSSRASIADGGP